MVKFPKKVKIGPYNYDLVVNNNLEDGTLGKHSTTRLLMEYKTTGLAPGLQVSTVLHEILHAICTTSGINTALRLNEEQHEVLVTLLEPSLYAFIKENPKCLEVFQKHV